MPASSRFAAISIACSAFLVWNCGSGSESGPVSGTGAKSSGGSGGKDASTGGSGGTHTGGSGGTSTGGTSTGGTSTGGTSTGGTAGSSSGGSAGTATGGSAGSASGGAAGADASTGGAAGTTGTGGSAGADSGISLVCAKQVSAGGEHSCAVKLDGSVWCWGADEYGQLGDGTITGTQLCYGQEGCIPTPTMVTGMSSGFAQVDAGFTHTCARTTAGALYCWGENTNGNLGDGTKTGQSCFTALGKCKPTPQVVPTLSSGVADVSVGYGPSAFSCARKTDSSVWCWGGGSFGFGGLGPTPTQVAGLSAVQMSSGGGHACALKSDGTVWCWGDNSVGQLGDGSTTPSNTPVKVALDYQKPFISISAGMQHACAVRTDGELWCWGGNSNGEVGIGTKTTAVPIPQLIIGMGLTTASVICGDGNTCGQKTDLTYWCWGSNGQGELGTGGVSSPAAPAPVSTLTNTYFGVDLGHQHSCGIKIADGTVWCWGEQSKGQIGNGQAYAPDVCTSLPQFCTHQPTKSSLPCP